MIQQLNEILQKDGPIAIAILSLLALAYIWRYYNKQIEERRKEYLVEKQESIQRHKERDNQYEELLKETISCVTKSNTLADLIYQRLNQP